MKIHEYQAKGVLSRWGIPVPRGEPADTPEAAEAAASRLGGPVVVKAQVHAGGRGKAGGIRPAGTPEEAGRVACQILGMRIKGLAVTRVLVEETVAIAEEYYAGITVDRAARRNVLMVSAAGGIDIEEVATRAPGKIVRAWVDPGIGLAEFQIRQVCYGAGLRRESIGAVVRVLRSLHDAYAATDAGLAEINPLALTSEGGVVAADAKMEIDDNALFRHPDLALYREESEEDPVEAEAHRRGIQYVRLAGDIGVIGNGAGLVMSTLDEVKRAGGSPADFLDIGGGARADQVAEALRVVLLDPGVKGVLFNIFGGITRCDEVARGILDATARLGVRMPIVVRLTGTNEAEGRALLRGTPLIPAETMAEAAQRIVELAGQPAGKGAS